MTTAADSKDQDTPISADPYRDEAFKASVSKSYRVWPDIDKARVGYKATPWFPNAFEWLCEGLREGKRPSMQVLFRWSTRDKDGDGSVSYTPEHHPTAAPRFVEGEINKLIAGEIADALAAGRFVSVRPERPKKAKPKSAGPKKARPKKARPKKR